MPTNSIRTAVYLRISQDRTGSEAGVTRQEQDCRALAAQRGWEVADVYRDNDISAWSGKKRPEYQRMLDDIKAGRIDAIVAWHSDRLYRQMRDLTGLVDIVKAHGIQIATVRAGEIDLTTASGIHVAHILGSGNQYSSDIASERISRASKQRAFAGRPSGGPTCYGYAPDGTIAPDEADAIRTAVKALLNGASIASAARAMPTRKGRITRNKRVVPDREWSAAHLRSLLLSPRLAGWSTYGLESAQSAARKSRGDVAAAIFSSIVAPGTWEAILDDTDWRNVVTILCDPRRRLTPGSTPVHLLSGLVHCAVPGCAAPLRVSTAQRPGQPARRYYRCMVSGHSRRPVELLEEHVLNQTLYTLDAELIPPLVVSDAPDTTDASGVDITAEINRLRDKLVKLSEQYADDVIDDAQFTAATTRTRSRINALEASHPVRVIPELRDIQRAPRPSLVWPTLPLANRRAIIRAMWRIQLSPYPAVGSDAGRLSYDAAKRDPAYGIQMTPTWS